MTTKCPKFLKKIGLFARQQTLTGYNTVLLNFF